MGRATVISGGNHAGPSGADGFAHAYRAVRSDPSIQFNLAPPDPPPTPPAWLEAFFRFLGKAFEPVGRFVEWIASFFPGATYVRAVLWMIVAVGAVVLLWAIYNRLRDGRWSLRWQRSAPTQDLDLEEEWAPAEAGARSWLEEADALAAEGRFAEAIHHLLFRSVEDIARHRPALVRPALTSRELAAAEGIPALARELFSRIARLVERSLFGGRPVRNSDWVAARQAYSDFALSTAWHP